MLCHRNRLLRISTLKMPKSRKPEIAQARLRWALLKDEVRLFRMLFSRA
jgi:hypothetical protein